MGCAECLGRTERQKQKGARHRRVSALAGGPNALAASQTPPLPPGKKSKKLEAAKGLREAVTTGKKAKAKPAEPISVPVRDRRQRKVGRCWQRSQSRGDLAMDDALHSCGLLNRSHAAVFTISMICQGDGCVPVGNQAY